MDYSKPTVSNTPVIVKTKHHLQRQIAQSLSLYNDRDILNIPFDSKTKDPISLGLVPTMGALHNGHKSLIESSVANNTITIVSIFVNPTQFAPTEDLAKYPRTLDSDMQLCASLGVDIVFVPDSSEMYELDEIALIPPKSMGYILEGYYRPTHFSGVLQIVLKLLNLMLLPKQKFKDLSFPIYDVRAYFGMKDAQQLLIVQKMVKDLCLPVEIVPVPIVRDNDYLALSSRNVYLSQKQRDEALALPRAVLEVENLILKKGIRDILILKHKASEILEGLSVDYMDFYTHELKLLKDEARDCVFLVAITVQNIRLLDNFWID